MKKLLFLLPIIAVVCMISCKNTEKLSKKDSPATDPSVTTVTGDDQFIPLGLQHPIIENDFSMDELKTFQVYNSEEINLAWSKKKKFKEIHDDGTVTIGTEISIKKHVIAVNEKGKIVDGDMNNTFFVRFDTVGYSFVLPFVLNTKDGHYYLNANGTVANGMMTVDYGGEKYKMSAAYKRIYLLWKGNESIVTNTEVVRSTGNPVNSTTTKVLNYDNSTETTDVKKVEETPKKKEQPKPKPKAKAKTSPKK